MKKLNHTPIRPPRDMIEEQVYARRWETLMSEVPTYEYDDNFKRILISYDGNIDQKAASVAASFVCWLGTAVGRDFLRMAENIRNNTYCNFEAYVAAWSVTNMRRFATNSNARAIEFLVRTVDEQKANVFPRVSTRDLEVVDFVALWLGSEDGQEFLKGCEYEIKRRKDMETIGFYHANGKGDMPYIKELEAQFIARE
jgi:hypothetical protein